ncbi:dihydrofolate reductase [Brevibacillus daliensis]|uniref:dihydrofolate reductase n=1 Tax=Brevibacillus daliensis TaxID=2892995 RepID=UPI001E4A9EF9|nr:dihydrofolate reductase [Brevibacillus daliensis]
MLSAIFAMGHDRVIGRNNQLPWHLPADLAYFRKVTTGHTVIMGRKTFDSIGKPLPNRRNIIVTTQSNYHQDGCEIAHSPDEVLELIKGEAESFVIGGTEIYKLFFPCINRMYITKIDQQFDGDAFFPEWNTQEWQLVSGEPGHTDEKNPYPFSFQVYDRH